jgi:hypothetical protein
LAKSSDSSSLRPFHTDLLWFRIRRQFNEFLFFGRFVAFKRHKLFHHRHRHFGVKLQADDAVAPHKACVAQLKRRTKNAKTPTTFCHVVCMVPVKTPIRT